MRAMTGEQAVDRYLRQRIGLGHFAPSTARNTRYALRSWLRWVEDWSDPSPDELVEWVMRPRSADAKHRRESVLRRFYRWAFDQRWLPVSHVGLVPTVPGSKKAPKPIPQRDLIRALTRADDRMKRAILLGRYGGLRASEIAAVHSDHLQGGSLWVLGKGSKERWVPAHPEVVEAIRGAGSGFVFPGRCEGHLSGHVMSKLLAEALPGAHTAHSLRHACGTELYEETGDLAVVAAILGHESTRTTERYVKVKDSRAAAAVARMTPVNELRAA